MKLDEKTPIFKPCLISENVYVIPSHVKNNKTRGMKYLVTINSRYRPVSMENKITQIKPLRYDALVNTKQYKKSEHVFSKVYDGILQ